jgi:hypothetical protein
MFLACSKSPNPVVKRAGDAPIILMVESDQPRRGKLRIGDLNHENIEVTVIKDVIVNAGLKYGDIIVIEKSSDYEALPGQLSWLGRFCYTNKIALYYSVYPKGKKINYKKFHWIGDFDSPTDIYACSFFVDGRLIGASEAGFEAWIKVLSNMPGEPVCVLGPRSVEWESVGPTVPYSAEKHGNALALALEKNRIRTILVTELLVR